MDKIVIRGARTHNLKDVHLEIPRNKFVVITGLSGSGKSSLAFDTIFAEGQRRYVESLSAYARQFLDQMDKPDVDSIEGLSPAIAIEQKTVPRNPRSSVGTITEIYDHLRLLWARVGHVFCWSCGARIQSFSVQQMVDQVLALKPGTRFSVLAPMVRAQRGDFTKELARLAHEGFVRADVDGELVELSEPPALDPDTTHTIEVYVDRLVLKDGIRQRLADSIELAAKLSGGLVRIAPLEGEDLLFSETCVCPTCSVSYPPLSPKLFSFNSPVGACPACDGLGAKLFFDPELIVRDPELSLREGVIEAWERRNAPFYQQVLAALSEHQGFDLDTPWKKLSAKVRKLILEGSGSKEIPISIERNGRSQSFTRPFEGVLPNLQRRFEDHVKRQRDQGRAGEEDFEAVFDEFHRYMREARCETCEGTRLRTEARHVKVGDKALTEVTGMTVKEALAFFETLELPRKERLIADRLLREIASRLRFLAAVGVDYLSLDRSAASLSGGEAQRIRLATQIGSGLVGVLYILDEPSIGLHPRDNARLLETLFRLRDLGNSVLVVEHDEETIRKADWVIDMGPRAGELGGRVVAAGPPDVVAANEASLTGDFLSLRKFIPVPKRRRTTKGKHLTLSGARAHNLKNVTVKIPLGTFVCVTGVSGSGKSSLIVDTLLPALKAALHRSKPPHAPYDELDGLTHVDSVIDIDQSPIGRTPRSNPATYTGLFGFIRELFAELPESKARGYKSGRYSFNVKGGRCETCQGDGIIRIEMHFLPDVYVQCDACQGRRYNRETLEIKYRNASVADVLDMTVDQAHGFLENIPKLRPKLETLREVGLGYVKLGQAGNTLSGGEAQRMKLAKELAKKSTGQTVYVLDEPTTGLHLADIDQLLGVLQRLVDAGNTVIVIEHDLDVIKTADWVIDLGPEGGPGGGQVVAEGPPEDVAKVAASHTGRFLRKVL
ncbi:MAG: excinuclease ABC subunit UvrA [Myxococcales bacterium]|nr:excinuclease ABC subunit UvrA [Myxococcales bacterium]